MPSASGTAYPRLKTNPSATELDEIYAPNNLRAGFRRRTYAKASSASGSVITTKDLSALGLFRSLHRHPAAIISHIARRAGYQDVPEGLESYDASTARGRHMTLVRNFVGVTAYGYAARKVVVDASLRAARTREDLPDIINFALEELARQRYELPGFSTLLKIARAARSRVNREYQARVCETMDAGPHDHWHIDFSYLNVAGTFYYLCTVLDGCSPFIVAWDVRRTMQEGCRLGTCRRGETARSILS